MYRPQNTVQAFQRKMFELANSKKRPTLLLHACCGPCASSCLVQLFPYFDITIYFTNPNIFPIEESNTNISDLLASENFNNFIQNIQNEYDYIIINSTPIESDSFLILNKLANISLFICTKNVTERKKIRYLESLIDSNKINNIAIVMNGLSEKEML